MRKANLCPLLMLVVLCVPLLASSAAPTANLDFDFEQADQTVLNRNGGLWNHLDLMTMTVDQLQNHIQTYPGLSYNGVPFSIGPLRLIHAFICLNPVGIDFNQCSATNPDPHPISPEDLEKIDNALSKAEQARVKIILRFAYNHGQGDDASLDVILRDIHRLAPLVRKYKAIIYAMNAGFIGYWGEGHDSTYGNNTQDHMQRFMQAEESAFAGFTFLLDRQPANLLSWEPPGPAIWGLHDDYYATGNDAGTWVTHPWDNGDWTSEMLQEFAEQRSDILPFSGEIGGIDKTTQTCEAFDAYSTKLHLNMMNIGYNTEFLSTEDCFRDLTNRIGPAISLVHASLNAPLLPGAANNLTLTFRNTGYSRLFTKVPIYFVLTDATGNRLSPDVFPPLLIPFDLTQLAVIDGQGSVSTPIRLPAFLAGDTSYYAALWLPDPYEMLRDIPEYNYLLNNKNVPNEQTGLNLLFPIHF